MQLSKAEGLGMRIVDARIIMYVSHPCKKRAPQTA